MGVARLRTLRIGTLRAVAMAVGGGGIAGMIGGSIADNNGVAVTFGLVTAAAALALIAVSAVAPAPAPARHIDEADARELEARIQSLVAAGADESEVRQLVRFALAAGRGSRS